MSQQQRLGKGNTSVFTEDGWTKIVFHNTVVVKWNEKTIVLDSGGWRTATTKTRMNQAANQYDLAYSVFQEKFEWWVMFRGVTISFSDGMKLDR